MDFAWKNQAAFAGPASGSGATGAAGAAGAGIAEVWGNDENGEPVLRRSTHDGNSATVEYFDEMGNAATPSEFYAPSDAGSALAELWGVDENAAPVLRRTQVNDAGTSVTYYDTDNNQANPTAFRPPLASHGFLQPVTYAEADGYPSVEYLHHQAAAVYPSVYADENGTYWFAQPDGSLRRSNGTPPFFPMQGLIMLDEASGTDYRTLGLSDSGADLNMSESGGGNGNVVISRGLEGLELLRHQSHGTSTGWFCITRFGNVGAKRSEAKTFSVIVKHDGDSVRAAAGLVDADYDLSATSDPLRDMEICAPQENGLSFNSTYGGGRQSNWIQYINEVSTSADWMKIDFVDTGTSGAVCRAVGVTGLGVDPFDAAQEVGAASTWTTNCPAIAENVAFGVVPQNTNDGTLIIKALKVH